MANKKYFFRRGGTTAVAASLRGLYASAGRLTAEAIPNFRSREIATLGHRAFGLGHPADLRKQERGLARNDAASHPQAP